MKRIFLAVFAIFAFATCLFADEVKSTGLNKKDVKNFFDNFEKIDSEMRSIEAEEPELLGDDDDFPIVENVSPEFLKEFNKIMNKHGISGKNTFDKFFAILYSSMYIYLEDQVPYAIAEGVPQKEIDDALAKVKAKVNSKDIEVVKLYKEQALECFAKDFLSQDDDDDDD